MRNYVLICNLAKKDSEANLLNKVAEIYPKHRKAIENQITFFSFAGRQLPEIMDRLKVILDGLTIQDNDYVAIYYTREEEPDLISRVILVGSDSMVESHINEHMSLTVYENVLKNLFEFDFNRVQV